jgi:hypothetical protein
MFIITGEQFCEAEGCSIIIIISYEGRVDADVHDDVRYSVVFGSKEEMLLKVVLHLLPNDIADF